MRRLSIVVFALGCGGSPKPASSTTADDPAPSEPSTVAPASETGDSAAAAAAIEWTEIRSWDGLFVIAVPETADVNEYLMALVPIRGNFDKIDFHVRIEQLPLTTQQLVAYEPSADGAKQEIELDSQGRVKFKEHYVEGGAKTALHDVVVHRGKKMAIVWESIYRMEKAPDPTHLAVQTEMASRFRLEKTPP